jgi:hypothetical protein
MQTPIETKRFIINKIDNLTIYLTELKNTSSTLNDEDPYDPYGAAKYIIIVVLFYGFVITFFIASQVNSQKRATDDVDGVDAEKILGNMQNEIFEREVLQKLSNREHREKAWNIYLEGHPTKTLESLEDQDNQALDSIQKRFRYLNRDNFELSKKDQEENKPLNGVKKKALRKHEIFKIKDVNETNRNTLSRMKRRLLAKKTFSRFRKKQSLSQSTFKSNTNANSEIAEQITCV